MKKLLLSLFVTISLFSNATVYLVQNGGSGDLAWSASTITSTGGTVVDLTTEGKSLPGWYNATFTVAAPAGTQIWVIGGTYVFTVAIAHQSNVSIYGGFSGTETTITGRAKPSNAKKWEFTNETVFDGNNTVALLFAGGARTDVTFDGFTVTKGILYAVKLKGTEIMQNCILKNNTANAVGNGAAMALVGGGSVKDCYFYNNTSNTATGGGGAIDVYNLVNPQVIERCIFENNNADLKGSSLYLQTTIPVTVKNCLIKGSTGPIDIYIQGNCNFYNNTIVNDGKSTVYISGTPNVKMYNNVIWGTSTNFSGGAASTVEVKNCAFMNAANASWTQSGNITLEATNSGTDASKFYPNFNTNYSVAAGSALINTGFNIGSDLNEDFWGTLRPQGGSYDIGYNEVSITATQNVFSDLNMKVFSKNGKTYFNGLNKLTKVSIFNTSGQLVITKNTSTDFELNLAKGNYIVKCVQNNNIYSQVIFVN